MITGTGSTVTVTSIVLPLQPFDVGVMRYVTLPLVIPSVDVNTWLINVPLPALAPLTFVLAKIIQLNVVPDTVLGLVIGMLVLSPLQIVSSLADAFGIGLTVTT